MDFNSVMETFAEAWVAANTHTPLTVAAEQGLINNGPNHTVPNRPFQALSVSSQEHRDHSLPIQTPHINIPTPTSINNDCSPPSPVTVTPPNQNLVDVPHNILSVPHDSTIERQEVECPSEREFCKVSEKSSEDSSTNRCSNVNDLKSSFTSIVKPPQGKSLPVHCIVEQIPGPQACGQHVELDSYAIVPSDTLFNDLVRTALGKLGYSTSQIVGAKGSIQIKKWKPLAFDQITENPEATVADILGELTTVASLHVRLYSVPDDPREWKDITVRNAVLELLREMSQIKLAKLCPLSQPMLSNIINNRYMGKIGKEKCQEFGLWYLNYRKQNPEGSTLEVVPSDRPADGRLTFHPTKELPLMRGWFQSCRSPSLRTLQLYVDILNQGPVRQQERPKVALSTLKNWWKNEKQRERKLSRDDDKIDEPSKPKKKRKSANSVSAETPNKNLSAQHSLDSDSTSELKSNKFTFITHSESTSDGERNDKDHNIPIAHDNSKSYSLENNKFSSDLNVISHVESSRESTIKFVANDFSNDKKLSGAFDTTKATNPNIFPKIHSICTDHDHSLLPFSDPHLSGHNCKKIYCSGDKTNENIQSESSEDDVDVGI